MRLTKLELNGFKSFARKTELRFEEGITAVIGPNGSGKSNIADAVRWVLGEQSAKALRGMRMEDVIFNGTQERKPQAYCEVTLTFDNSDHSLPTEYAEVAITRRVYRSGESEYSINRNNCRLRDIQELFRDTGIGKEGYSIIGQGKVDEIISNKSNDRRATLEEAAGVMRYRTRKEEAERKLENTQKNLVRIHDILSELELQLEPLEKQSEDAKRFLLLRDELKELDVNVFLHQWDRYHERERNLTDAIEQLTREIDEKATDEARLQEECAQIETRLAALDQTISQSQNDLLASMSDAQAQIGELKVLEERMENQMQEHARVLREQEENRQRALILADTAGNQQDRQTEYRDVLEEINARVAQIQKEADDCGAQIARTEALLETQKNSLMESLNRIADAKSALSRYEAMRTSFKQRLESIAQEETALSKAHMDLQEEYRQAQAQLTEASAVHDAAMSAYNDALTEQKEQQTAQEKLSEQIRICENEIHALQSRHKVLLEMAQAHEGYYASVRNVLRDSRHEPALKACILGTVAEIMRVPKEYETALESALGTSLQNIVTPTPEDAKYIIEYLRKKQYGRATLLPVSSMRPRALTSAERAFLQLPGCIGVASELVEFAPQYRNTIENLLGRTVLVEDLEAAIAVNKKARSAFRIATLQGDIINPGGSMTGGSLQKKEFSLIGREREIGELLQKIEARKQERSDRQQECAQAKERADAYQEQLASLDAKRHEQEITIATLKEKADIIARETEQNVEAMERFMRERAQIDDSMAQMEENRAQAEGVQSDLEEGNAATREDVLHTQAELNKLRAQAEKIGAMLTEQKVQQMAAQKEQAAAAAERGRLQTEIQKLETAVIQADETINTIEQQIENLRKEKEHAEAALAGKRKLADEQRETQSALEDERMRTMVGLNEKRDRKDAFAADVREMTERRYKQELNLTKNQMELDTLKQRIWDEYELTYEDVLPMRKTLSMASAHVRMDEIRESIRALGDVNVNAIRDFQILKERRDMLNAQYADLEQARGDLETLIFELTASIKREFLDKFQTIQTNFSKIFSQLFGGGHAELRLADKEDVLNCEIEIIAQPPGKKLQLLSLLSGGERALTAIALLFAMLSLKPTAFCILDEIESSLDEVNVTRFAEYLKDYSADTQFIIITHRKGSMEVSNCLYGIAMEEQGVSKIVSAKFADAV